MFLASLEGRGVDVDTTVNSRLHLFVTNFVTCSCNIKWYRHVLFKLSLLTREMISVMWSN